MRSSSFVFLSIIVLTGCSAAGTLLNSSQPEATIAQVEALHAAEQELVVEYERPEPTGTFAYEESVARAASNIVFLEVDGTAHASHYVMFCKALTEDFSCNQLGSEDGATQFEEYAEDAIPFTGTTPVRLLLHPQYVLEIPFVLFTATEDSSVDTWQEVAVDATGLHIPVLEPGKNQVLLVMGKGKGDSLVKKYAWVLRPE